MVRFQSRILDPVRSCVGDFLFCERLRSGLYEMVVSGRATLKEASKSSRKVSRDFVDHRLIGALGKNPQRDFVAEAGYEGFLCKGA